MARVKDESDMQFPCQTLQRQTPYTRLPPFETPGCRHVNLSTSWTQRRTRASIIGKTQAPTTGGTLAGFCSSLKTYIREVTCIQPREAFVGVIPVAWQGRSSAVVPAGEGSLPSFQHHPIATAVLECHMAAAAIVIAVVLTAAATITAGSAPRPRPQSPRQ